MGCVTELQIHPRTAAKPTKGSCQVGLCTNLVPACVFARHITDQPLLSPASRYGCRSRPWIPGEHPVNDQSLVLAGISIRNLCMHIFLSWSTHNIFQANNCAPWSFIPITTSPSPPHLRRASLDGWPAGGLEVNLGWRVMNEWWSVMVRLGDG